MRFKAIAALGILSLASIIPAFGQATTKIGVITSLTGSLAAFGEAHKNGYAIALDEINAKGGVLGKKIELDFYYDQLGDDLKGLIGLCFILIKIEFNFFS